MWFSDDDECVCPHCEHHMSQRKNAENELKKAKKEKLESKKKAILDALNDENRVNNFLYHLAIRNSKLRFLYSVYIYHCEKGFITEKQKGAIIRILFPEDSDF